MATQVVQINLPDEVYRLAKGRALRMHHTIEEELVAVLAAVLPEIEELPTDIVGELEHFDLLNDEELWQAAHASLPPMDAERMQALVLKRQRRGLEPDEHREADELLKQFDRCVLVRSKAAQVLKERGHDVSVLKKQSSH